MSIWRKPQRPIRLDLLLMAAPAAAWGLLLVEETGQWPADLCSVASRAWAGGMAQPDSSIHWMLMVAAMMFPLLGQPLRHLHDRSLARRRTRAKALFLLGYTIVWLLVGPALQRFLHVAKWAAPADGSLLAIAVIAVTALWQLSPAKQWFLNRCHRQPRLSAFGPAADRDALSYGLKTAVDCVGACWALMLLPLLFGHAHLLGMAAITVFTLGERLEAPMAPAWGWHGPNRALRIAIGRASICFRLRAR